MSSRQRRLLKGRLRKLGFKSYAEYLTSETWHETRQRYKGSKRHQKCFICFGTEVDLHHRTYARLGEERLDDLIALCRYHHDALHKQGLDLWDGPKLIRQRESERLEQIRTPNRPLPST